MDEGVNIFRIQIVSIVAAVILISAVFYLLRKHRLREEYSILLFGGGFTIILFSVWRGLLEKVSHFIGIDYAPSMLFTVVMLIGVIIFIHFSIVISGLADKNKRLAQKLALLELKIENKESLDR